MLFVELKSLLSFISVQAKSESSSDGYFNGLEIKTWSVIKEVVIDYKEDKPEIRYKNRFFFEQFNGFVSCFSTEIKDDKESSNCNLVEIFNGNFYGLVKMVASGYLTLLTSDKTKSTQESFIKLIMLSLCESLLLHILTQQYGENGAPVKNGNELTTVIAFVDKIILPLLSEEGNDVYINALSSMTGILSGEDKSNYLNYLVQVNTCRCFLSYSLPL